VEDQVVEFRRHRIAVVCAVILLAIYSSIR